jgi:integration host factor subunit beta
MTKSDLVQRLAEANPHLYRRDAEVIVTAIFDEIAAGLSRGVRVELRGFGAFTVKKRAARIGHNPATGERFSVSEKHQTYFRTSEQLRDRLGRHEAVTAPDPTARKIIA